MRNLVLGAVLALASISGCSKDDKGATASAKHDVPTMTVDEVDKALAAKQAYAFDCNSDRTRKKVGTLPGAILISDEELYPASELPADKTAKLIFYCSGPG